MFEVQYDPSGVQESKLTQTIMKLGYQPSLSKPTSAVGKVAGLTIHASPTKKAARRGKKLKLVVVLAGRDGHKIAKKGTTKVTLSGPDGFKCPDAETLKGGKSKAGAKLTVKVGKQAAKGDATITLTVEYTLDKGGKTTTGKAVIKVPVFVR